MAKQTAIEWLQAANVDTSVLEAKLKGVAESHAEKRDKDGNVLASHAPPVRSVLEGIIRPFVATQADAAMVEELVAEALEYCASYPATVYEK